MDSKRLQILTRKNIDNIIFFNVKILKHKSAKYELQKMAA